MCDMSLAMGSGFCVLEGSRSVLVSFITFKVDGVDVGLAGRPC